MFSPDYPRPQLRRPGWESLDGVWEFAIDPDAAWSLPEQVVWDRRIAVPFAPEAPLSGVGEAGFFCAVWYRRTFAAPPLAPGERLILRFGAVDYAATVWINGAYVGAHEGGYTPFGLDISDHLRPDRDQIVVVRAFDDPRDLTQPRGKQDWRLEPHRIWYPRTTGIWQTVWLERLPTSWIDALRWSSDLEAWSIGLDVAVGGRERDDLRLEVELTTGAGAVRRLVARDQYTVVGGEVHRQIALSDPGIDDFRNELLWSPLSPNLIEATLRLVTVRGEIIDEVESYTALRAVTIQGDRFVLNGRPFRFRLVLDQGYWPDGGLTAPTPSALRRDVELARAMGFNGVRKHQKIEDPRYHYWADRLGLVVWEEMPSAYRFDRRSVERLTCEWMAALERDRSHPCIVTWVPFNESWGVPDLPSNPAHRHYIDALYHLTKTLDPSRPVIGNDGWESAATDIIGIHDYDPNPDHLRRRYAEAEQIPHLFRRENQAGRLLTLDGHPHRGQPLVLSEFGGIAYTPPERRGESWGYSRAATPEALAAEYAALLAAVRSLSLLSGFCYTQFADAYQETNGLLTADRVPKLPLEEIAAATTGNASRRVVITEQAPAEAALRGD